MSETFTVWHGERNSSGALRYYITAINVQELGNCHPDFVRDIADQLGLNDRSAQGSLVGDPFFVDYLSSDATDEWRDTWLVTWVLEIRSTSITALNVRPVDVFAIDSTWDGEDATATAFEVVARGSRGQPDLSRFDRVSAFNCRLGHLHVRVPVFDDQLDRTARVAIEVKRYCASEGWTVDRRERDL